MPPQSDHYWQGDAPRVGCELIRKMSRATYRSNPMKGVVGGNRALRSDRTKSISARKVRRGDKNADEVLERLPVGIARFGPLGRFAYVNPSLCRLMGYSRIELLALTVREVSHDKNHDFASRLGSRADASFQVEKRLVRKDGVGVWVALSFDSQDGLCVVEDISARKQLEIAHQSSEQRFSSLARLSSDWYWEQDTELRFTFMQSQQLAKSADVGMIGKRRWEMGFSIEGEGGWEAHWALLKDRKPQSSSCSIVQRARFNILFEPHPLRGPV